MILAMSVVNMAWLVFFVRQIARAVRARRRGDDLTEVNALVRVACATSAVAIFNTIVA